MKDQRIIMVGHGAFANRGCEAIVRCTVDALRSLFPDAALSLVSHRYRADAQIAKEMGLELINEYPPPFSVLPPLACRATYRLGRFYRWRSRYKAKLYGRNDAVVSLGGDNITPEYPLAGVRIFIDELRVAQQMGVVTVLWGATLGPFDEPAYRSLVLPVLQDLDLIVVRDYESRDALHAQGISENVVFAPDPAFMLRSFSSQRVQPDIDWVAEEACLGVSVSGFLLNSSQARRQAALYARCLKEWVRRTGQRVLLVPHVNIGRSLSRNDYEFSRIVARGVNAAGQVRVLSPTLRASEYKAAIGACQLFMGSRMHATISALSQAIPTLSLSYSRKAGALQEMLLGHKRLVCHLSSCTADELVGKLSELSETCEETRMRLRTRLAQLEKDYQQGVKRLGSVIGSEGNRRDFRSF